MKLLSRININLLPLKICMLFWWGGNNALLAYMAVHMKSLGLNVWQVGLIHALLPIAQVTGQLGCGVVADRFRLHKMIIMVAKMCAMAALTAISFIPAIKPDADGQLTNVLFTFYTYLFLRLFLEFCCATSFNLFETIAVLKIRQFPKANFGNQRFFASLGAGTIPGFIGFIMDSYAVPGGNLEMDLISNRSLNHTVQEGLVSNFNILFYIVDGLIFVSVIVGALFVNLDYKAIDVEYEMDSEVETSNFKTLLNIAIKPNAFVFILTVFFLGTFWGYTKIFVPWRMSELGSDKFLIGICPLLSTAMGLILIILSERLFRRVGHVPVMIFAFVIYSVRFLSYSLLTSAKYFLIFETLEGVTYHLLWIAVVPYAALLTPASLTASVQGFMGSVHYCVGIGVGGLIGGATISDYGPEIAFRVMSVLSLLCSIAAGLFFVLYSKRRSSVL